ncbi:unnamed protein product [Amoebophrya sp. A120]|nr:unnamed protein product [Amoebophrya sp. A120]|eukprot:GSA120T00009303001.1
MEEGQGQLGGPHDRQNTHQLHQQENPVGTQDGPRNKAVEAFQDLANAAASLDRVVHTLYRVEEVVDETAGITGESTSRTTSAILGAAGGTSREVAAAANDGVVPSTRDPSLRLREAEALRHQQSPDHHLPSGFGLARSSSSSSSSRPSAQMRNANGLRDTGVFIPEKRKKVAAGWIYDFVKLEHEKHTLAQEIVTTFGGVENSSSQVEEAPEAAHQRNKDKSELLRQMKKKLAHLQLQADAAMRAAADLLMQYVNHRAAWVHTSCFRDRGGFDDGIDEFLFLSDDMEIHFSSMSESEQVERLYPLLHELVSKLGKKGATTFAPTGRQRAVGHAVPFDGGPGAGGQRLRQGQQHDQRIIAPAAPAGAAQPPDVFRPAARERQAGAQQEDLVEPPVGGLGFLNAAPDRADGPRTARPEDMVVRVIVGTRGGREQAQPDPLLARGGGVEAHEITLHRTFSQADADEEAEDFENHSLSMRPIAFSTFLAEHLLPRLLARMEKVLLLQKGGTTRPRRNERGVADWCHRGDRLGGDTNGSAASASASAATSCTSADHLILAVRYVFRSVLHALSWADARLSHNQPPQEEQRHGDGRPMFSTSTSNILEKATKFRNGAMRALFSVSRASSCVFEDKHGDGSRAAAGAHASSDSASKCGGRGSAFHLDDLALYGPRRPAGPVAEEQMNNNLAAFPVVRLLRQILAPEHTAHFRPHASGHSLQRDQRLVFTFLTTALLKYVVSELPKGTGTTVRVGEDALVDPESSRTSAGFPSAHRAAVLLFLEEFYNLSDSDSVEVSGGSSSPVGFIEAALGRRGNSNLPLLFSAILRRELGPTLARAN